MFWFFPEDKKTNHLFIFFFLVFLSIWFHISQGNVTLITCYDCSDSPARSHTSAPPGLVSCDVQRCHRCAASPWCHRLHVWWCDLKPQLLFPNTLCQSQNPPKIKVSHKSLESLNSYTSHWQSNYCHIGRTSPEATHRETSRIVFPVCVYNKPGDGAHVEICAVTHLSPIVTAGL